MAVSDYNAGWGTGQDNVRARLTDDEARAARELRKQFNLSQAELARMYNTSKSAMSLLLRGITYKDAGGPVEKGRKAPDRSKPGPRSKGFAPK